MASLPSLAMSSTKDELLKHLNLPPETYALMAKETDRVYLWLTSEKAHLKSNCKRKPPYDWSDIQEKSKDDAMKAISTGGDEYTDYYWRLAAKTEDCPNWIARWFLYHKFRYRDGRNRTHPKSTDDRKHHHDSKQGKHHKHKSHYQSSEYTEEEYNEDGLIAIGTAKTSYPPGNGSSSGLVRYSSGTSQQYDYGEAESKSTGTSQPGGNYYDPVRDV